MLNKRSRPLLTLLFFFSIHGGGLTSVWAAPDSVITVGALSGQLTVKRKGKGKPINLRSGQSLALGDVVSTGSESRASIIFPDGAQIRLNARASVEVTPPHRQKGGKLSLFRVIAGQVWARLRPNNAVETRTAVLGVRGTEILVDVAEDDSTTLTVTDGSVDFYNQFGAVTVDKDQQSVARVGSAPTFPVTIQNANFIVEWTLDLDRAVIPREQFFNTLDRAVATEQAAKLKETAAANPADAAARSNYGDALFDSGQYEAAAAEYAAALEKEPTSAQYALRLGSALLEEGRLDEAQQNFASVLNGNSPLSEGDLKALQSAIDGATPAPELPAAWTNTSAAPAWSGLASVALKRDRPE
ncbi:tetratricopeptide repeat protein, partial [bacterium]